MATPLAERLRPQHIDDYIGQYHLIGPGKPVRTMIDRKQLSSMILWGPPGTGKTSLANVLAREIQAEWVELSAVTNTVSDVRQVIAKASEQNTLFAKDTVIFLDEIHRFNKAQQDALLPVVEKGTITLIGATTENPGFTVNAPLISRTHVYQLFHLSDDEVKQIVNRAIENTAKIQFSPDAVELIIAHAQGDARVAMNAIELVATSGNQKISKTDIEEALQHKAVQYDRTGDAHYDTISAFIKSMRGNAPDATLHYLARMIAAGEDPLFIARRMVIFASEDIGNAQPTALVLATTTMQAVQMIGMPEAKLILAQTATYLATAKKSIASTIGIGEALHDLSHVSYGPIPNHLRNPANTIMKQAGYGKGHTRYPWLEEQRDGRPVKQEYMPENLRGKRYYRPKDY